MISGLNLHEANRKNLTKKPNIIFILSDDHTTNAISAYGGLYKDIAPTPNIDKIARDGAILKNTFATNSICGPSRASILTGTYNHINGYYKITKEVFLIIHNGLFRKNFKSMDIIPHWLESGI